MGEIERIRDLEAAKIAQAERLRLLYSIPDLEQRRAAMAVDAVLCEKDFRYWCDNYGVLQHPHLAKTHPHLVETPFILWPAQIEAAQWLLELLAERLAALIPKSREIGITWLILHLFYWLWRFHKANLRAMSRVEELVDREGDSDTLFQKLDLIHERQPPHLREPRIARRSMVLRNLRTGAVITGSSTSADAGRGGRSLVAFVDEFRTIEASIAASLVATLEANAASTWWVYNPNGTQHPSYHLYKSLARRQVREMNWQVDPYRDESFRATKVLPPDGTGILTPAEFEREYNCSHTAVSTGLLWSFNEQRATYDDDSFPFGTSIEDARRTWAHEGGWDFGSGPSDLVCLFAVARFGAAPGDLLLAIDDELVWNSERWYEAGTHAALVGSVYRGPAVHWGDPAGINRESDQSSWVDNLRRCGIPLVALPAYYNTQNGKEWAIKLVQLMLDEGRLVVHRRCKNVLAALGQWRRNAPDGVDPKILARAYIAPRHDELSHPGHALLYLVAGALSQALRRHQEESGQNGAVVRPPSAEQMHGLFAAARTAAR